MQAPKPTEPSKVLDLPIALRATLDASEKGPQDASTSRRASPCFQQKMHFSKNTANALISNFLLQRTEMQCKFAPFRLCNVTRPPPRQKDLSVKKGSGGKISDLEALVPRRQFAFC